MFAGKKSAQIREILISESAWEEMTCLFAPSLSNIYPLKLMDQSREMWAVMNRLIELTGWIVLVVSVILLGVASHIDNYQPPEQSASVQHK